MDPYVGAFLLGKFYTTPEQTEVEDVPFLVTKVYNPTNVGGWYFTNSGNLHYSGSQVLDGDSLRWPDVPGTNVSPVVTVGAISVVDPGHVPDPAPEEGTPEHFRLKQVDQQNPYTPESANA